MSDGCVRAICTLSLLLARLALLDDDVRHFELLSQEIISAPFSMVNAVRHKNLFAMQEKERRGPGK